MSFLKSWVRGSSTEARFKMDHEKRGYLTVIDNHTFNNPRYPNLTGSEHDVKNLIDTFVCNFDQSSNDQPNDALCSRSNDHTNVDCFMAVSQKNNSSLNEQTKVFRLTDLTEHFKNVYYHAG